MVFNEIKIDSKVFVTAALMEHTGYVDCLDDLIDEMCVIKVVDHLRGKCRVESTLHGDWWFPLACVIHVHDKRGISIEKNRVGLRVSVFNLGLLYLNLSITGGIQNRRSRYNILCGKPAIIVSDIKPILSCDRIRNAYFVDVKIDGEIYELPLCSLRTLEPEYKSREIHYAI